MNFKTEQEHFWAGDFGDEYVDRNSDLNNLAKRTAVFSKILMGTRNVNSVLEFGASIGHNLIALKNLLPSCQLNAIEINTKAIKILKNIPDIRIFEGSILDFSSKNLGQFDLTFTSGVLIHIKPNKLQEVYSKLYECSNKYIIVQEYYNPKPIEINYRGHSGKLFKRDFAGEIMNLYPDLELVDYGFQYHRDYNFSLDDLTWFLLRKTPP